MLVFETGVDAPDGVVVADEVGVGSDFDPKVLESLLLTIFMVFQC